MKNIYCEEFQNITQHSFNNIFDISNKESLHLSTTLHDTTNILSNDNMEVSNELILARKFPHPGQILAKRLEAATPRIYR